jgi:hydrogenase/urease accessory protein HupE
MILSKKQNLFLNWALGLLMVLVFAIPSAAHWADLAVADLQIDSQTVAMNWTVPTGLLTQFDDNKNQQLSASEVAKHQTELQKFLSTKVRLQAAGENPDKFTVSVGSGQDIPSNLNLTPGTHSNLLLEYRWPQPIKSLQMHYEVFADGVATARCLTQVRNGKDLYNLVFTPSSQDAILIDPPLGQQIISFIGLGIEHIFTGYDHILFLVSLLMLGGTLRSLVKVVTAFSVSHSVTLFLAALNIISVPSRWVEIAIALSIAYIAAESIWNKQAEAKWPVAFGFGLIHGLGFSGILQELALPRTNLLASIASFSLGIELGQVTIVVAVYAALHYLQKLPWHLTVRRLISIGIIIMSLIWFWERAFAG